MKFGMEKHRAWNLVWKNTNVCNCLPWNKTYVHFLPVVLNEYACLVFVEESSEVLKCLTQDSLCLHHLLRPSENVPAGNEHSAQAHTTAFQWKMGIGTSVEPAKKHCVSYSNNIGMNVTEIEWIHGEWMCNLSVRRQPSHHQTLMIFRYK